MAGEKVHPKEVEDLLLRHPHIRDACVARVPHQHKGVLPVAFVCEWKPGTSTEDDIKRFCLQNGAAFAHPRRVICVEALPLGSMGTLDRSGLKKQALEFDIPVENRRLNVSA